ncbi:hypothetical protein B0H67DRAFT_356552 [Lasiosphaeris hirsuta]|uniref:Uncharacterized protein n=1 Tax=Lasiosphaeris hirsuta TaxID=260670 RepID=A0AA39ZW97_9PEZI|nr:hypothetical protein B0H67DRAFT_356552 [Lasiosphaeris hirsuta]
MHRDEVQGRPGLQDCLGGKQKRGRGRGRRGDRYVSFLISGGTLKTCMICWRFSTDGETRQKSLSHTPRRTRKTPRSLPLRNQGPIRSGVGLLQGAMAPGSTISRSRAGDWTLILTCLGRFCFEVSGVSCTSVPPPSTISDAGIVTGRAIRGTIGSAANEGTKMAAGSHGTCAGVFQREPWKPRLGWYRGLDNKSAEWPTLGHWDIRYEERKRAGRHALVMIQSSDEKRTPLAS